jgi:hypothetical protein
MIDDDEIIVDKNFIGKALEIIGREREGKSIDLIVGYYLNEEKSPFLDQQNTPWWQIFWDKNAKMNEAFQVIVNPDKPRFVTKPTFAFGGLMVIHKNCWLKVPFDPLIARGEDMDYLRNSHFFGINTCLDRELSVIHKPPTSSSTDHEIKFSEDVKRFLYAEEKLITMGINPEEYNPYPGYFLKHTKGKVLLTELLLSIHKEFSQIKNVSSPEMFFKEIENFKTGFRELFTFAEKNADSYLHFQKQWESFMRVLMLPFNLPYIS